jgi:beta-glucanase (GH16 family)
MRLLLTAAALVVWSAIADFQYAKAANSSDYQLVWSDEFNVDGPPDPKNWTFEHGFVRNEEAQWYQPENARCENGMLVITGRREQVPNPNYKPDSRSWKTNRQFAQYTSACLTTQGLHDWLYGRFEMRARIDTREGLWPAFWSLGTHSRWPANGEVDIMEYYHGELLANIAWAGVTLAPGPKWNSSRKKIDTFPTGWSSQFHIWRMDWDENKIELSVDGQLLNHQDLSKTINNDAQKTNPFHRPEYLLLNMAIGGKQGGDPSKTKFPAKFEVDYVRVYQRRGEGRGTRDENTATDN